MFYVMALITCIVILKHEKSLDNLSDLVLKVSGTDFEDIENSVVRFVTNYNRSQSCHEDHKIFDWFIADRQDLAELDSQVHSYWGAVPDEEDDK